MRELDFEGEFDAVIAWGGSFGYFSDAENLDVLRRFARALKPGGCVLIDQLNRENILRHFRSTMRAGDVTLSTKWRRRTERVETTWTMTRHGRMACCRSTIRLHTPGQLRRLFSNAGLEIEAMYGNLDGSEYSRGSRRIYIVGLKI